jgi:hypothetical protein
MEGVSKGRRSLFRKAKEGREVMLKLQQMARKNMKKFLR